MCKVIAIANQKGGVSCPWRCPRTAFSQARQAPCAASVPY